MTDYIKMWESLNLDMERHAMIREVIPKIFSDVILSQQNRPNNMEYFDWLMKNMQSGRVKEILDKKEEGKKLVGVFCVFVPEEIVVGSGNICVGLCAGSQMTVPDGETVLPRNTCPMVKSLMGFKLANLCPYFQATDLVVGETTCDGKKKAWEILDEKAPTYVMELPQRKTESDMKLWEEEVNKFKEKVEELSGRKVTAEEIAQGIKIVNAKREVLQRLQNLRAADPAPISGKDSIYITQLSFFDDQQRFTEKANQLCDELEERVKAGEGVFPKGTPRILLAGTPMPLPYWKAHNIIETSGAVVVGEESCIGTRYFESRIGEIPDTVDEQVKAIAKRSMGVNCSCFTPNNERTEDIVRLAKELNADGVIYYNLMFCGPYSIEYLAIEKRLEKEGIPVMKIESDYSPEDAGQLKTRIEAFIEMVRK